MVFQEVNGWSVIKSGRMESLYHFEDSRFGEQMKQTYIFSMLLYLILQTWLLHSFASELHSFDYKAFYVEQYIRNKEIRYKLGGVWPTYYDCGGVVTEAIRSVWYRGYKLNSRFYLMDPTCRISASRAKRGDIMINENPGQGHVALITDVSKKGLRILDYVKTHQYPSYRSHGIYPGVYAVSLDCILSQKHYLQK